MATSPPEQPSLPYAMILMVDTLLYTLLLIFFLWCAKLHFRLCRRRSSPIHMVALSQCLIGVLLQIIHLFYTFLLVSCSVYSRISTVAVNMGIALLTVVLSIQVYYLYQRNRYVRYGIFLYILIYVIFALFLVIHFEPTFDGIVCNSVFSRFIPTVKLCIDFTVNTTLGVAIIYEVRNLAIATEETFWRYTLIQKTYYLIIIIIINLSTTVLVILEVLGVMTNLLYYIDWVCACGVMTIQMRHAQDRRDEMSHTPLPEDPHYGDAETLSLGAIPPTIQEV